MPVGFRPPSEEFEIAWRQARVAKDHYSGRTNLEMAIELAAEFPLDRLEVSEKLYEHSIANRRSGELLKRQLKFYLSKPRFLQLVKIAYCQQKLVSDGYIVLPQYQLGDLLGIDQSVVSLWINHVLVKHGYLVLQKPHVANKQCADTNSCQT